MPLNEILALAMFVAFILLVFSGFPVAWILAGLAMLFTAIAIIFQVDFAIPIGIDWSYTSLTVERIWNVMENWVMWHCRCSFLWGSCSIDLALPMNS